MLVPEFLKQFVEFRQGFRDNVLIRRTAALALGVAPERARTLPAVAEARDLLALPPGQS